MATPDRNLLIARFLELFLIKALGPRDSSSSSAPLTRVKESSFSALLGYTISSSSILISTLTFFLRMIFFNLSAGRAGSGRPGRIDGDDGLRYCPSKYLKKRWVNSEPEFWVHNSTFGCLRDTKNRSIRALFFNTDLEGRRRQIFSQVFERRQKPS